jgi:hypothetical protein
LWAFGAHFLLRRRAPLPLVESLNTRCSAGSEQRHKIAQDLLDFRSVRSVCGGLNKEATMDRATIEPAIKIVLTEIHSKLNEAARIAKAAEACALAGSVTEAVTVSMDIEQLIYEAGHLQDAASLLNRPSRE